MPHALIHVLEPARAAQYAVLVEPHGLSATLVRTLEEALFHLRRLGPAALILTEIQSGDGGFALLQGLRDAHEQAPALVISGSWRLRNEALRLRKKLDIFEVLAPSQPLATVQKAVERTLGPSQHRPHAGPVAAPSFPPVARRGRQGPDEPAGALAAGSLEEVLDRASQSLGASIAVAWIEAGSARLLRGHFGWDASIVSMVGTEEDWAPFRRLCSAPVVVEEAAKDKVLRHSALVRTGMVGSFAGAPLVDAAGANKGALWVAHREPFALRADVLEPLTVWAQNIGARFAIAPLQAPLSTAPPQAGQERHVSALDTAAALAEAALGTSVGVIITDDEDRIAFSNKALLDILGLRNRRLAGLSRAGVIARLRAARRIDSATAALLRDTAPPLGMEIKLSNPDRSLAWEMRPLRVGEQNARIDEIADVTGQATAAGELVRFVRVDPLTWLGNSRSFSDALAAETSRAMRFRTPLSVVLFLVDGAKSMPPQAADLALRDVAWLLADMKRGYDFAARIDASTLAVILPAATTASAMKVADRLVAEVADLERPNGQPITISAGVAEFDAHEDVDGLLGHARAAVLEASACGGNGVL